MIVETGVRLPDVHFAVCRKNLFEKTLGFAALVFMSQRAGEPRGSAPWTPAPAEGFFLPLRGAFPLRGALLPRRQAAGRPSS